MGAVEETDVIVLGSERRGFIIVGLAAYTNYTVSVRACTVAGCGRASNQITAETLQEGTFKYMPSFTTPCFMCAKESQ